MSEILENFCAELIEQHKDQFFRYSDTGNGKISMMLNVGEATMLITRSSDEENFAIELSTFSVFSGPGRCVRFDVVNDRLRSNCYWLFQSLLHAVEEEKRAEERQFIENFKRYMKNK